MILHINVGPDRHGNVPKVMEQRLTQFGDWVKENQEAIYATQGGPWQPKENQYGFCYKDDVIYVYLLDGFKGTSLTLPPTDKGYQVVNAYQVADKKAIQVTQRGRRITLHQLRPTGDIQVIALKMNKVIRQ
jgi:alpha-L-fucosidase